MYVGSDSNTIMPITTCFATREVLRIVRWQAHLAARIECAYSVACMSDTKFVS